MLSFLLFFCMSLSIYTCLWCMQYYGRRLWKIRKAQIEYLYSVEVAVKEAIKQPYTNLPYEAWRYDELLNMPVKPLLFSKRNIHVYIHEYLTEKGTYV